MLNIHLTLPIVANMLRLISQRDPERVGREDEGAGCTYASVKDGALYPICIVGQMFADLGLLRLLLTDPSDIVDAGYAPSNLGACTTNFGFWESLAKHGVTADEDAKEFMRDVQMKQDEGERWGEAYTMAVETHVSIVTEALNDEQRVLDRKRQALTDLFG